VTEPAWRREDGDGVLLMLHAQPGAKRTEVAGVHGEGAQARLRIRLAAPPVEGKANAELLRFLAVAFAVSLRDVTLVRGETSRQKTVRIARPARRPDREWMDAASSAGGTDRTGALRKDP
jgi:uncharacterized protein (TIGR00251 family)